MRESIKNWSHDQKGARYRNRRGVYQSLELKANSPLHRENIDPKVEVDKVEQRLRTIEMITQFRQKKIKREITDLEEDLKLKEDLELKERRKIILKKQVLDSFQEKIGQFRMNKLNRKKMEEQKEGVRNS